MSDFKYCRFEKEELMSLFYIVFVFSIMFSILFMRFSEGVSFGFLGVFFNFFMFFALLFSFKEFCMKLMALRDGFEIRIGLGYVNKYGLAPYEKLSYWADLAKKNAKVVSKNVYNRAANQRGHVFRSSGAKFSGIPMTVVSIIIYFLTLGLFIYPNLWRHKTKVIPHRFVNTQQRYEMEVRFFLYHVNVSDYRLSKSFLAGFLSYFAFGFLMKLMIGNYSPFYVWFLFALFWIAFVTLIPLPGSDGFHLQRRNLFAWFMTLSILIVGMISLLVFEDLRFSILAIAFTAIVTFFIRLQKSLLEDHH